tara:strand:+ start:323 stop:463 length:141 start_codon:yes stop_codon:yes gene_type:complete
MEKVGINKKPIIIPPSNNKKKRWNIAPSIDLLNTAINLISFAFADL